MFKNGKKILVQHSIAGALLSYFIFHPLTMAVYMFEFHNEHISFFSNLDMVFTRIFSSFQPEMLSMSFIFVLFGGVIGMGSGLYYRTIIRKEYVIKIQENELQRNIASLISTGENDTVEFKSTLRWDLKLNKINKELENIVLKTIAGFMNYKGGTLLIGVADSGEILGLNFDYNTLNRHDRDGFEQHLIQIVSDKLGTYVCTLIHIIFHSVYNAEICRIIVDTAKYPVYVKDGNKMLFFVRTGNSTRELNTRDTVAYISSNKFYKN